MKQYNRNRPTNNWQQRPFNNDRRKPNPNQENRSPQGLAVYLRDGEDINKAIRKLKKKIERAGILKELRDRQHYVKPSEKRRKAKKAGIMRWKKKQRETEMMR